LGIAGVVLVAAIAVAIAIGLPQGAATSALELRDCTIGDRAARCGRLAVPENPSVPDGRKIGLDVAVVPATGGRAKPDPLFWLAGWGSAGVADDAANVLPLLWRVNTERDLVFVDQRGTGSSELVCPLLPGRDPAGVRTAELSAAARRCAGSVGPGFRHYTSAVAVDDFDRVRRELGYETLNLYGVSYGVTTGQIYLLRHGAHVRTAVFDSGSLLEVRIFEHVAPNAQAALEQLLARCAADTACGTAFPQLRREFASVQARLAKTPIAVPGATVALTPATFAMVVEELLASTEGKAILPRVIHLVATGQVGRAATLVPSDAAQDTSELAYQLLIQCNEPWASRRPADVARLASGSFFAPAAQLQAGRLGAACRGVPDADVPAAIGQRVRSQVPVLFLSGDADPADPPANVAHARRELPNSRTVVFPGAGHGQLGLLCAQNLMADFVEAGTAAGLDTACAATAVQQQFDYSD
jgi:pimeloyl-ACP methyl ester carboxylesterase